MDRKLSNDGYWFSIRMNSEKYNEIQNWHMHNMTLGNTYIKRVRKRKAEYGEKLFSFFTHFLEKYDAYPFMS